MYFLYLSTKKSNSKSLPLDTILIYNFIYIIQHRKLKRKPIINGILFKSIPNHNHHGSIVN